jgi:hypothetical protein
MFHGPVFQFAARISLTVPIWCPTFRISIGDIGERNHPEDI